MDLDLDLVEVVLSAPCGRGRCCSFICFVSFQVQFVGASANVLFVLRTRSYGYSEMERNWWIELILKNLR